MFKILFTFHFYRSPKGTTPILNVPYIRSKNYSVCAIYCKNGMQYHKFTKGSYNGEKFKDYLKIFMEKLKNDSMGHYTFIMDNVRFHKMKIIIDLFKSYGHDILFLPPYSPFLNPIENVFSK